jgi:hypothetical protein
MAAGLKAVHRSAEGASAASTISVTCEFALATGHFNLFIGLKGIRAGVPSKRAAASQVVLAPLPGHLLPR